MPHSNEAPTLVGRAARLIAGGEWTDVRLAEISPRAARFETDRPFGVGDPVVACIAEVGALAGVVETVDGGSCSVVFRTSAADAASNIAACYSRPH